MAGKVFEKFFLECRSDIEKKHVAFEKFAKTFYDSRLENSLATRLVAMKSKCEPFKALADGMRLHLQPIFSDETPRVNDKYHPFNVWFLGATEGLELIRTGGITDDRKYEDLDYGCDRCVEGNELPAGRSDSLSMSIQTALYIIFGNIPMDDDLINKCEQLQRALSNFDGAKKLFDECQEGSCICERNDDDNDDQVACGCDDELTEAEEFVTQQCVAMFTAAINSDFCSSRQHFFAKGLGPYKLHDRCKIQDQQVFIVRKADDEAAEKQRIAEREMKLQKELEQYELKTVKQQLKQQKHLLKESKKRLAELEVKGDAKKKK